MSVRNLADIGINGQKIVSRLMANQNLVDVFNIKKNRFT